MVTVYSDTASLHAVKLLKLCTVNNCKHNRRAAGSAKNCQILS